MESDGAERPRAFLLVRDREELALAAGALQHSPSFVIAICPDWLHEPALEHLAELLPQALTFTVDELSDASRATRLVFDLVSSSSAVVSCLKVTDEVDSKSELFAALNLHREKLKAPDTRFVLWLPDPETFGAFIRAAPDAYAYRDRVMDLRGEYPEVEAEPEPEAEPEAEAGRPKDEPSSVAAARVRVRKADLLGNPIEAADARRSLSQELFIAGRLAEAEEVAVEGLSLLEDLSDPQHDHARLVRAMLLVRRGNIASARADLLAEARYLHEARRICTDAASHHGKTVQSYVLSDMPPPPGFDGNLDALLKAQTLAEDTANKSLQASVESRLGMSYLSRGDMNSARDLIDPRFSLAGDFGDFNEAVQFHQLALLHSELGDTTRSIESWRKAIDLSSRLGNVHQTDTQRINLSYALLRSGEKESARRSLQAVSHAGDQWEDLAQRCRVLTALAVLALEEARVDEAEDLCRDATALAADQRHIGSYHYSLTFHAKILREAFDKGLVAADRLSEMDRELEVAQSLALDLAGDDPPWYRIVFLRDRAEHLAHRPARIPDAIELIEDAWALCTNESADLAPGCGRRLGEWLIRAGNVRQGQRILDEAEAASGDRHIPLEEARIHCSRLKTAIQAGATAPETKQLAVALRNACRRTGSRITEALLLLEAARELPASQDAPEPLSLIEEARRLFTEMPWPYMVGACHEAAGDVLARQGSNEAAHRRYKQARGRYQRIGSALGLHGLARKLTVPKH